MNNTQIDLKGCKSFEEYKCKTVRLLYLKSLNEQLKAESYLSIGQAVTFFGRFDIDEFYHRERHHLEKIERAIKQLLGVCRLTAEEFGAFEKRICAQLWPA